jgi:hypothetical protein
MSEFDGSTRDELDRDVKEFLNPAKTTPAEDAKKLADDTLRVKHIMGMRAEDATPDDREFLRAEIQATLRGGF